MDPVSELIYNWSR